MTRYNEVSQKDVEYLILLLLGGSKQKRHSVLHIEKEFFILQRASKGLLEELFRFVEYYRGPYSKEIYDAIRYPKFLDDSWTYEDPVDDLSGGYVRLTDLGIREYRRLANEIASKKNRKLSELMVAMDILHDIYDKLSPRELLYVIYTSPEYKAYTTKSIVLEKVVTGETREMLRKKLIEGIEDEPR